MKLCVFYIKLRIICTELYDKIYTDLYTNFGQIYNFNLG